MLEAGAQGIDSLQEMRADQHEGDWIVPALKITPGQKPRYECAPVCVVVVCVCSLNHVLLSLFSNYKYRCFSSVSSPDVNSALDQRQDHRIDLYSLRICSGIQLCVLVVRAPSQTVVEAVCRRLVGRLMVRRRVRRFSSGASAEWSCCCCHGRDPLPDPER